MSWTPTLPSRPGPAALTEGQVQAFDALTAHYADFFGEDSTKNGLIPKVVTDPQEIRQLTAFFAWTAWAAAADRPGHDYSYTNNWPAEPRVDNGPTADVMVWSVLSLIVLLGGTGALFFVYGRWSRDIGWHSAEAPAIAFRQPGEVGLTPAQRATSWFFFVIALLFFMQALLGSAAEHYRADILSFFGFDLAQWLPFNLARTWHEQLALFWTAAAFLAAGIFLTPFVAGREPRRQSTLAYILLGAVAVVVFGSLASEALSIHGVSWAKGPLFAQQWEYLDLPFVYQVLLTAGLFIWIAIIWRGIRSRLQRESKGNMPWLFFFSALAIPAFYAVGLLARTDTHLSVAEFWRFWVVHLWVEDFLELFTTVMVAYIFVMLGVVRERIALGVIFLDVILYSAGGVIGTMHHLYFSGTPVEHMALGAFFSAAEVIPLTFLTVEAWSFLQLGSRQESRSTAPFPHRWAVMFLRARPGERGRPLPRPRPGEVGHGRGELRGGDLADRADQPEVGTRSGRSGHPPGAPQRPQRGPPRDDRHPDRAVGVSVRVMEIKDVEIPEAMQRAMAREAEAERERRAKVINARGELQASEELRQAADTLSRSPASLQLRYLQTLLELGADHNSTVVFPLPIDIIGPFLAKLGEKPEPCDGAR